MSVTELVREAEHHASEIRERERAAGDARRARADRDARIAAARNRMGRSDRGADFLRRVERIGFRS